LEKEAFGFTWDHETYIKELGKDHVAILLAKLEGKILGSAMLQWIDQEVSYTLWFYHPLLEAKDFPSLFSGLSWLPVGEMVSPG